MPGPYFTYSGIGFSIHRTMPVQSIGIVDIVWAIDRMAYMMQDELWGYFGLATQYSDCTSALAPRVGRCGLLTLNPNIAVQRRAFSSVVARCAGTREGPRPAQQALEALEGSGWTRERQRIIDLFELGLTVDVTVEDADGAPLIGWEYAAWMSSTPYGMSSTSVNPFTWFRRGSATVVAIERSDETALAAVGPTMMMAHEIEHRNPCSVNGNCYKRGILLADHIQELQVIREIDRIMSSHPDVAQRCHYGSGIRLAEFGPGPDFSAHIPYSEIRERQNLPGRYYVMESDGYEIFPENPTGPIRWGRWLNYTNPFAPRNWQALPSERAATLRWVRWPSEAQLRGGRTP